MRIVSHQVTESRRTGPTWGWNPETLPQEQSVSLEVAGSASVAGPGKVLSKALACLPVPTEDVPPKSRPSAAV